MTSLPRMLARCAGPALAALIIAPHAGAADPEYRGQWVDGFHTGALSASEVTTTVRNLRDANSNVFIPEVRLYADAWYKPTPSFYPNLGRGAILSSGVVISNLDFGSSPEPRKNASFDSLGECIRQAHDTTGGKQRLDVWPWLVSFRARNAMKAAHPDWITRDNKDNIIGGLDAATASDWDPGHPGVAQHLTNVYMDIVSNYDVDGVHFDYIRFSDSINGYNPVSIARFNARYKRTGKPANNDPDWNQWRRDQVTNVVRKIYLNVLAIKPDVKVTGSLICFSPGPTRPATSNAAVWKTAFEKTRPYNEVFQDWRSWLEEGIMDVAVPMAYLPNCTYPTAYGQWMDFVKENQFGRQGMIGPGTYLETLNDAILQLKQTRLPSSPGGKFAAGQAVYSYASPYASACNGAIVNSPATMSTALRTQAVPDPVNPGNPQPLYPTAAPVPALPRLTNGLGHLMGTVTDTTIPAPGWVDGARVLLSAPGFSRNMYTDGTGFYGFVDVPPGTYSLIVYGIPGQPSYSMQVEITAHQVATANVNLPHYTLRDAARALFITGGVYQANESDMNRLNVSPTAGITLEDAIRVTRKATGLEPNP